MTPLSSEQWRALFEPRGVVVAGASSHPGKFGFVALRNILRHEYPGAVFATNLEGGEILGRRVLTSIDDLPEGGADLVFVCTPAAANLDLLKACAAKGVKAAFVTSVGYGEAGEDGRAAERELVTLARDLGMLLVGPNGQGVVSTPASLCAQIVAPYPPAGGIAIVSQSGNFVSSFQNYAVQTSIGVSRAVSAGNAAAVTVPDFLEYFAADDATTVALAYVEGVSDGRGFFERISSAARRRQACRGLAHRSARVGRADLRRHVPPGRCDPPCHRRGGVRGGSHVRDATASAGAARRRAHNRRRMGRGHRRRRHARRARAAPTP